MSYQLVDFSVLKSKIGQWADDNRSHAFVAYHKNLGVIRQIDSCQNNKKVFILPHNPTAEKLAAYLFEVVCPSVLVRVKK